MLNRPLKYNSKNLENIFQFLSDNGYSWETNPAEMLNGKNRAFIRHDVDVSLKIAYQMALMEKEIGVKSVYFVMVNSPFYNIQEIQQNDLLRRISNSGFQIGLHANIRKDSEISEIEDMVEAQREVLQISLGSPISLISFHHPTAKERCFVFEKKSLFNIYQLSDFKVSYFSDSNMQLDINALEESAKQSRNIQLLIHPIWWYSKIDKPGDIWEKMILERASEIRATVQATERTYEGNN